MQRWSDTTEGLRPSHPPTSDGERRLTARRCTAGCGRVFWSASGWSSPPWCPRSGTSPGRPSRRSSRLLVCCGNPPYLVAITGGRSANLPRGRRHDPQRLLVTTEPAGGGPADVRHTAEECCRSADGRNGFRVCGWSQHGVSFIKNQNKENVPVCNTPREHYFKTATLRVMTRVVPQTKKCVKPKDNTDAQTRT